eukprot:3638285-Amphidinium_carterae.1
MLMHWVMCLARVVYKQLGYRVGQYHILFLALALLFPDFVRFQGWVFLALASDVAYAEVLE